jgi:hypothetical protein
MIRTMPHYRWFFTLMSLAGVTDLHGQKPPYDVFPLAEPPYYRVRYEASTKPGELMSLPEQPTSHQGRKPKMKVMTTHGEDR